MKKKKKKKKKKKIKVKKKKKKKKKKIQYNTLLNYSIFLYKYKNVEDYIDLRHIYINI